MADTKVEGQELKKLVKLGKQRTMNFAYVPGEKNDHTLIVDRRLKPGILGKAARKQTGATRFAFGTFDVEGKVMTLSCEKVVPTMAKRLKKYLKSQKIPLNVVILDADGGQVESDIEDLPEDPDFDRDEPDGQGAPPVDEAPARDAPAAPDDTPSPAQLAARLKQAQPALAGAQGDIGARLKKAVAAAVAQIKAGDLAGAEKTIATLEAAAGKLASRQAAQPPEDTARQTPADTQSTEDTARQTAPDAAAQDLTDRIDTMRQTIAAMPEAAATKLGKALTTATGLVDAGKLSVAAATLAKIEAAAVRVADAPPPGARKWAAAQARLQAAVDSAMSERRGDLDAINRAYGFARDKAEAGDYDSALKAAARVADLLKQADGMQTTAAAAEAAAEVPEDVVPFVQSRLMWGRTRQALRQEMQTLKDRIEAMTAGMPGLEDVPAHTGVLFDQLDRLDGTLEEALDALAQSPDGDRRAALKARAAGIVGDYRGVLDAPFFQAVDDNGFAETDIRGAALAALQQVDEVLTT